MPPKKRKIPPHPSGMAQPPMSKADIAYEKRREVVRKFFDSAETRGDFDTPSIRGALDKVPKTASVGLSSKGELLINNFSRGEFHAHGCPYEFRNYKYDESKIYTVDGCVGQGDDNVPPGWYFEGTLTDENGGKCDIESYYSPKNKKNKMREFTLTNFIRNGVTTKENVFDFITAEDQEELKQQMIEEVFDYYTYN